MGKYCKGREATYTHLPLIHTYQSHAHAINTNFGELFSPKHIYVKYENAICDI